MRYVQNLIPEQHKVLKNYFKGNLYHSSKANITSTVSSWVLGIFFLVGGIASLNHPVLALVFGMLGFILIPPGHRYLEKLLRFRLTTKIKTIASGILFILAMPLTGYYGSIDTLAAKQLQLQTEQEEKTKAEASRQERIRQDSLAFYLQQGISFENEHNPTDAFQELNHAEYFVYTEEDRNKIKIERTRVSAIKTFDLVQSGKYNLALPELNTLIAQDDKNPELYYNRALCYSKTGKIKEAAYDCQAAMVFGYDAAEKLHNKINPIRKHIIGTVTRCCDGTTSYATGRGACSHHDGVCNWNDPIYEESRQY